MASASETRHSGRHLPPGPPVVISRCRIEYHGVGTGRNYARHRSQQGWGEAAGTQAPPDHRSVLV